MRRPRLIARVAGCINRHGQRVITDLTPEPEVGLARGQSDRRACLGGRMSHSDREAA